MITFLDSLIGMDVRFWAKLLDMSHHPYILCQFAATFTNMLCMLVVCIGLWKASVVGSAGNACDVHGE